MKSQFACYQNPPRARFYK